MPALAFGLVFVALTACGKPKENLPDIIAESATKDLADVKKAIAAGTPRDAYYTCAGGMASVEALANTDHAKLSAELKKLTAELKTVCTVDLPIAVVKVHVETTEAARKAKPDEKLLSECYDAHYVVAIDALTESGNANEVKDLVARYAAACPEQNSQR